jgi:hypothetical protein
VSRRLRFDIRRAGRTIAIVLGVLFLLDVAFWLLAVRPTTRTYQALLAENEPTFNELARQRELVEQRETFLAALDRATADLTELRGERLSTREQRMIEVQAELDRLVRQFNINLESVTYSNPLLLDEGLDRFEMVVPLEGGYANLRRFLQAVEESQSFLLAERVVLGEAGDGGSLLQLNITLATYFNAPDELVERHRAARGR